MSLSQRVLRQHRPVMESTPTPDGEWRFHVVCPCGWTGRQSPTQAMASGDHLDHVMQMTV